MSGISKNGHGKIRSVIYDFDNRVELIDSVGDTWCPAWAADDNLYSSACDGSGFEKKANSNLFMNKITGPTGPENDFPQIKGETVNPMNDQGDPNWNYGPWAGQPNWKANGLTCIDRILYLFVSRHGLEFYQTGDRRVTVQRAWDSSIIKSVDYGITWTRPIEENTKNPMFPGRRFGSPFFVQYGRDGRAPADNADRSDEYIYAAANDGYWNNGNDMVLGRVRRTDIASLDPSKWEFYTGGDGAEDRNWTNALNSEAPGRILTAPRRLSQASISYIEHPGRYLMLQWFYNPGNPPMLLKGEPYYGWGGKTYLDAYEAPHPWGPWAKTNEVSVECGLGWYNPVILNKFTATADAATVKTYVACAGDFAEPQTHYKLNLVPLTLKIDAV